MTDRKTNWPVVLLVTALVASLAYNWYLRGEVDLRDRRYVNRLDTATQDSIIWASRAKDDSAVIAQLLHTHRADSIVLASTSEVLIPPTLSAFRWQQADTLKEVLGNTPD